jgi:hypothetical protein
MLIVLGGYPNPILQDGAINAFCRLASAMRGISIALQKLIILFGKR